MEFYTYVWRDAFGVPFYVGKGKGRRARDASSARRSSEFIAVHSQGGCTVEVVDYFIHESQAHAHEVELIECYGRREFGGTLVNKTDGGEGASGSVQSKDARTKISETNRLIYASNPTRRASVVAGNIRRWQDPAARARQSGALSGLPKSMEHRRNLSLAQSGKKLSEEHRANIGKSFRGKTLSVEHTAKVSESARFRKPKSGYKGVSLHKQSSKWQAQVKVGGKIRYLGTHETPEMAALKYDSAAIDAWGVGNCYLNFPAMAHGEAA
ncbi:AP2 domain-containing protein [Mesorhizobium sp.]|uniref:AP2 domain-containing protein n=1 Tax=Mesorhizobium sp. TaxID=1871066 RepID=UPI0012175E09|nr:AP2 domain-containing protein [Mesorhizobium sp.]TIL38537.1 MAG: hypothetical protein E5Y82_13630 [Mesorhizobium sp.]